MTAERTLRSGWKFEAARHRWMPYLWPVLLSMAALSLTDHVWRYLAVARAEAAFGVTIGAMNERLQGHLRANDAMLHGAAGLFAASDEVTRQDWARYVASLRLDEDHTGIQGVGYAQWLTPAELPAHVAAVRAQGFADYSVLPAGPRAAYSAIVYLEPFHGRNIRAFGFDMYSESVRQAAMARSRDAGDIVYSGPVRLMQETEVDVQTGVLAYFPVYRAGAEPRSVTERRQALQGWVYMPLRVKDLLQAALGDDLSRVQVELTDLGHGGQPAPTVLYSSMSARVGDAGPAEQTLPVNARGHMWRLRCAPVPGLWVNERDPERWVSLGGVALACLMLWGVASQAARRRQLASSVASELASGLADSEERFRLMVEGLQDQAFYLLDPQGMICSWNSGAERIKGWRPEEIIGQHFSVFYLDTDREAGLPQQALTTAALNGQCRTEGWRLRKDGSGFQANVLITALRDEHGQIKGFTKLTRDISEQHRQGERLRLSSTVFRSTQQGVAITDAQGVVLAVNPAFERITEFSEADVLGQRLNLLASGRHDRQFFQNMWRDLLTLGSWQGEIWNRRKGGEIHAVWLSISAVRGDDHQIINHVALYTDVTRIPQAESQMARMAHHDALTGLPNRVLLQSRLAHSLERARRGRGHCAVLFLDLDEFKPVNDRLGHEAGDEVLKGVAARLHLNLRENDTVARWGGDEFVVVLEDLSSPEGAEIVARAIIERTQKPFELSNGRVAQVGCSVGIALFPLHGDDEVSLLRHADEALYVAKGAGRGAWCFHGAPAATPV